MQILSLFQTNLNWESFEVQKLKEEGNCFVDLPLVNIFIIDVNIGEWIILVHNVNFFTIIECQKGFFEFFQISHEFFISPIFGVIPKNIFIKPDFINGNFDFFVLTMLVFVILFIGSYLFSKIEI